MVYFSDFFELDEKILEGYGAFNISLINDLPLFIDPFLLFVSDKPEYKKLHSDIMEYLKFLKTKSEEGTLSRGEIMAWYKFSEIKQNWLGYSLDGNGGSGLGMDFGTAMSSNMSTIFKDLNKEKITTDSHLEKAGLFQIGVGRDNISDFTCNLIKSYLCGYTEGFAKANMKDTQVKEVMIDRVVFDYSSQRWISKKFTLPFINGDYVLLTPKDLLTKDENWINLNDIKGDFDSICNTIPNEQLRAEIHNYFRSKLPAKKDKKEPSQKEVSFAVNETIHQYPEFLDFYIKLKEENKIGAKTISKQKVEEIELLIQNIKSLIENLNGSSKFYCIQSKSSLDEAKERVVYLKKAIEENDGYKLFYIKGKPMRREADLQIMYRLTWFSSPKDVNSEVNNGRGPVDYKISQGAKDSVLVEFKLASNSKLKMNLENQVKVYEKANGTVDSIKVILYFNDIELAKVNKILKELKLQDDKNIILIDACDNKPSASNQK